MRLLNANVSPSLQHVYIDCHPPFPPFHPILFSALYMWKGSDKKYHQLQFYDPSEKKKMYDHPLPPLPHTSDPGRTVWNGVNDVEQPQ